MIIIVYRMYHERDCYELTFSNSGEFKGEFVRDKDWINFVTAVDDEYPFEIIKCTKTELDAFKKFASIGFDFGTVALNEIKENRIVVKRYEELLHYEDAADLCHDEIKELQDKIQSLQYNMDIYDNIYYDKYHCHITEKYND